MLKFGWPSFGNSNKGETKPTEVVLPVELVKTEIPEEKSNVKPTSLDKLLGVIFEPGASVKVKRSNGQMEEGWRVGFKEAGHFIQVTKQEGEKVLNKNVLYRDLVEWNMPSKEEIEK